MPAWHTAGMPLRLATWNCRGAVDKKRALFDRLSADVIVVPECAQAPRFAQEFGVSFAWRGENPRKGLGVFGLNGWQLEPVPEPAPLPWLLPLRLIAPDDDTAALLLAIWTVPTDEVRSYADQITRAVAKWETEIRDGATILVGDFNCSAQSTDFRKHLVNVRGLEGLGAVSAYHAHHGLDHGDEQQMTLRWIGRGSEAFVYHCDFVFASAALVPRIRHVEVGTFADWIEPGYSDHCPVIVDFADVD